MHGTRYTKAVVKDYFGCSARFIEYFEIVTKKHAGVELRPKRLRRGNAEQLQEMNATPEVRQSFSALMGTGIKNLEGAYDQRSALAKGFLAAEVQRRQFCPLFNPEQQTVVMPALIGTDVLTALARLIRQDATGQLFALFQPSEELENGIELTDMFVHVPAEQAELLIPGRLITHAETSHQIWRSKEASIRASEATFALNEINPHEFAVKSRLTDVPELAPKDIVYVAATCAIAEVKSINAADGSITLAMATELHDVPSGNRHSMQTYYRFTHNAPVISVSQEAASVELLHPLDLAFAPASGHFILRKSSNLVTV